MDSYIALWFIKRMLKRGARMTKLGIILTAFCSLIVGGCTTPNEVAKPTGIRQKCCGSKRPTLFTKCSDDLLGDRRLG